MKNNKKLKKRHFGKVWGHSDWISIENLRPPIFRGGPLRVKIRQIEKIFLALFIISLEVYYIQKSAKSGEKNFYRGMSFQKFLCHHVKGDRAKERIFWIRRTYRFTGKHPPTARDQNRSGICHTAGESSDYISLYIYWFILNWYSFFN